jgi:heme/copper-type cytochrome/quinol oxidase subunit 4
MSHLWIVPFALSLIFTILAMQCAAFGSFTDKLCGYKCAQYTPR